MRHRLAEGFAIGSIAALLWAAPVAFRTASPASAYIALSGSGALWLGPLVGLGREALSARDPSTRAWISGVMLSASPVALLFFVLATRTHHRPLGGVVWALLAMTIMLCGSVFALRVRRLESGRARAWLTRAVEALAVISVAGAAWLAFAGAGAQVTRSVVDTGVGALAVAASFRWRAWVPVAARRHGFFAWAALSLAGLAALARVPGLTDELMREAPVVIGAAALMHG